MADMVTETFQKIMDEMREDFRQAAYDRFIRKAEKYEDQVIGKTWRELFGGDNCWKPIYQDRHLIDHVFDTEGDISGVRRVGVKDKYVTLNEVKLEAYAKKEADYQTMMMFDGFVAKNTRKMEGVLKGVKVEKIDLKLNKMNLTGRMQVWCEKGAGFDMSFQIEFAYSTKGKLFARFPTRFHDAVKTDGTKIKSASESKMKKEFA